MTGPRALSGCYYLYGSSEYTFMFMAGGGSDVIIVRLFLSAQIFFCDFMNIEVFETYIA